MTEKIIKWCGFCIHSYWTDKPDGDGRMISLKSIGIIRNTAEEAWEDALRFEGQAEESAKKEGHRLTTLQPGICPPTFIL